MKGWSHFFAYYAKIIILWYSRNAEYQNHYKKVPIWGTPLGGPHRCTRGLEKNEKNPKNYIRNLHPRDWNIRVGNNNGYRLPNIIGKNDFCFDDKDSACKISEFSEANFWAFRRSISYQKIGDDTFFFFGYFVYSQELPNFPNISGQVFGTFHIFCQSSFQIFWLWLLQNFGGTMC